MDKAILKKFAIESRKDLMEKIKNKINTFYVDEEFKKEQKGELYILSNEKHSLSLTQEEYKKRELLIKRIKELSLEQVIEEAAYTWFNRIIAIRYMEINDYLPLTKDNQSLGIRVLSSKDNTPDPEILKFTNLINPDLDIDFKKEKYAELKDDNEKFKYVLLLVCKKLGRVIPQVFDGVTDYIDILIPDNLLNDTGFVTKVINEAPEDNFKQVEIIGWLYQYYNQTEKDRVISAKKAYKKNEIPYATQLFTPDWIVKYMVENSLGRYWVEHNGDGALYPSDNLYPSNNLYPSSSITDNWKYFIKENIEYKKDRLNPTEITFIDPCCGSGHILVYAFEVFYQIYLQAGYNKKDISELILKNNLYGLDIDDRAGQLSILSVLLKAREYDKEIFNKEIVRNLNIMSIQESNTISEISIDNITTNNIKEQAKYLIDNFRNAKEIGSLLILNNDDYSNLEKYINDDNTIFGIELKEKLLPIIKIAIILSKKYDIVITNPPYMGERYMSPELKKYVKNNFGIGKSDLFSAFILRIIEITKENGKIGLVSPYVWFFIKTYYELRKKVLENTTFESCVQLEYNAFEAACVPVATFILEKSNLSKDGVYIRLSEFKGAENQGPKFLEAINNTECTYKYVKNAKMFKKIPNNTFAYWIGQKTLSIYDRAKKLSNYAVACVGLQTSDNKRFLREWYEVSFDKIGFNISSIDESISSHKKWFPYNKGGGYRKWFGNILEVVNWENDGKEIRQYNEFLNSNRESNIGIANTKYYFKESGTWGLISSSDFSVRYSPNGAIFDTAGSSIFCDDNLKFLIGLLNSNLVKELLLIQNPTLNFTPGNISDIPVIIPEMEIKNKIEQLVDENIETSKNNWNIFEISWDFQKNLLLNYNDLKQGISESLKKLQIQKNKLLENEIKLNKLINKLYDVENEISDDVNINSIVVSEYNQKKLIVDLIGYAVGCMFGRYSLDKEGLIYAGGDFDEIYKKHKGNAGGWAGASLANYKVLNDNGKEIELSFEVDNDNVIPITDEAYFGDDIVERFKKFISVVYGEKTLNENLDYIAETLGKKGTETSEDTIRRYFVNDFFNDHVKIYQKRPIYWLFDSGKKNGFKALIYMHRYNENLVPKIRLDYLHRMQTTYEKLLSDINYKLTTELTMTDKKEAQKRQADLNAKLQEIKEYDEKIAHIANQRISIDLDNGVKVNYEKFKDILAKIK